MKKSNKSRNVVVTKSTPEAKRNEAQRGYGQIFLQLKVIQKCGNKSIYLSSRHHERLTRIVQTIGSDKIPLYAYLENILEHHFEMFEKAITDDFNEKFKPIF